MAETLDARAKRLLTEGRLTIRHVDADGLVIAEAHGFSGARYSLGYLPAEKRAGCTCEAGKFGRECTHMKALWLVVNRPADIKRIKGRAA